MRRFLTAEELEGAGVFMMVCSRMFRWKVSEILRDLNFSVTL